MSRAKPRNFPGRDDAFFFRTEEQRYLANRVRHPGITIIKGGPRSGKSWLLGRALRQLDRQWPQPLIGFCRCSAQDSDTLGRVIDDLAMSWRERANLLDQAREIFNQNRNRWPQLISEAVSHLITSADPFGPVSSLVANTLKGLPSLEPGAHVPRLKYEQGQDLIKVLAEIAEAKQVILVLDQWEQSTNLTYELEHLRNFSRDCEDWPPTHFLIAIRSGSEAERLLEEFSIGQSGFVETYLLPGFDIDSDPDERQRLIDYLRAQVPACRSVDSADKYLPHIKGHPAVLDNWTRSFNKDKMQNLNDLVSVATEAQNGRYPEFGNLVPQLPTLTRKLSIRLGLLPNFTEKSWPALKPILMEGIETHSLDDLFSCKLLEETAPPSLGHQQRSDYFLRWLLNQRKAETGEEYRILVRKLAGQIREVSETTLSHGTALVALALQAKVLRTDVLTDSLCEAAIACFGTRPACADVLLQEQNQWCAPQQADVAGLVALALFNTCHEAGEEFDFARRNALLDELRRLVQSNPTDATVRKCFAKGLVNAHLQTINENDVAHRDALQNELGKLYQAYPTDTVVRERIASDLVNTYFLAWHDEFRNELRRLAETYPNDTAVREALQRLESCMRERLELVYKYIKCINEDDV